MKNFFRFGSRISLAILLFTPVALMAAPPASLDRTPSEAYSANAGPSTTFAVQNQTEIPGRTLEAGSYRIRVVDQLKDRMIIAVDQPGKKQTVFLALPKSDLSASPNRGAIELQGGIDKKAALRGFVFPNGLVAEFVYPKAEAVSLAKANDTTIPAIDPASEGMPKDPTLSQADMRMVTLWMLTPARVGPNDSGPGVSAKRYQQVASVRRQPRPAMKVLPHTASEFPLMLLLGILMLMGGGMLSLWRFAGTASKTERA